MDLKKSFQEQENGLLFQDETGNVFRANLPNCRWVSSTRQGINPLHLAHPTTKNPDSFSFQAVGGNKKASNQRLDPHPPCTQSNNHFNNNDPNIQVSVDPITQNSNHNQTSSDDTDDDQDEESDSTESISTDESDDNNQRSPTRQKSLRQQTHLPKKDEEKVVQENNWSQGQKVVIHEWPTGRPLPYPKWDHDHLPEVVHFEDVLRYEEFAGFVELVSQRTVAGHKYNTVDNFIRFYRAFKKSKVDSLESFYRQYQSPLTPCHYTCVGLAYELIAQINATLPPNHPAVNKFYVTSCEEAIGTAEEYVKNCPPDREIVEKEHVSICLKIQIGRNRSGCLLLDPGYHVSRPVTIMHDGIYPHTGKFIQNDDGSSKKEYEYTFRTSEYINWDIIETKRGKVATYSSLIFIAFPFLSGMDCAERRNLVYDFKSCLKRDPKGQVVAGLYFQLKKTNTKKMTIIFMENNNRINVPLNVSRNVKETREIQTCEDQMKMKRGKLTQMMNSIGRILHDESFLDQTLRLNAEIVTISAEN